MDSPVRGGSLGSTRHLSEVEPGDPVLRIGVDRVTVVPNRLVAVPESGGGITQDEVRLH